MAKLLVSVRNAPEALLAVSGGADLVDVKEPARGPLGAADAATIEAIVGSVAGQRPVSAALGELSDGASLPSSLAGRLSFAKFGLAGSQGQPDWQDRWRRAIANLPAGVRPVAVVYADHRRARAPDPWAVFSAARELQCAALLVDTFDKSQGSLRDAMDAAALAELVAAARGAGMLSVLAGGMSLGEIAHWRSLSPDYFAVRGAACRGGRQGPLEEARVRRLAEVLHVNFAGSRCS